MNTETQAFYQLIDAAYAEQSNFEWNQAYHAILLKYAKALTAGKTVADIRVPMYIELYQLPYFRPMTLPKAGRDLYGTLHQACQRYDAKELRRQALGYGLIVASGTWGLGGN